MTGRGKKKKALGSVKEMIDHLEKMTDRLNHSKPKTKLLKSKRKKSSIPGMSYWFSPK